MLRYGEAAGGRVLRMEPRARGVDYGPVVPAAASPAMDREMRLAHNKKCARPLQCKNLFTANRLCVHRAAGQTTETTELTVPARTPGQPG